MADFKEDHFNATFELDAAYFGTGHALFRQHLFYYTLSNAIVKYDVTARREVGRIELPESVRGRRLYADKHTVVDLSADENDLWVVYPGEDDSVWVAQVDPDKLELGSAWRVPGVRQGVLGEGFIACGVLYFLESGQKRFSNINLGFDVFTRNYKNGTNLEFVSPYTRTTMLQYDYVTESVISWDNGRQLTYPLLM